jgi:hypothetical protein
MPRVTAGRCRWTDKVCRLGIIRETSLFGICSPRPCFLFGKMRALAIAALLFACASCGVMGGRTESSFGVLRLRGGTGRGGPSRGYTSNGSPWRWRHPQTMSLRVRQGLRGLPPQRNSQHNVFLLRRNGTDETLTGLACGLAASAIPLFCMLIHGVSPSQSVAKPFGKRPQQKLKNPTPTHKDPLGRTCAPQTVSITLKQSPG